MKIHIHHLKELRTSVEIKQSQAYDRKWQENLRCLNHTKQVESVRRDDAPLNNLGDKLKSVRV